jgi:hypothetical protein
LNQLKSPLKARCVAPASASKATNTASSASSLPYPPPRQDLTRDLRRDGEDRGGIPVVQKTTAAWPFMHGVRSFPQRGDAAECRCCLSGSRSCKYTRLDTSQERRRRCTTLVLSVTAQHRDWESTPRRCVAHIPGELLVLKRRLQ